MRDNLPPGQSDDLLTLRQGRLRGFKDLQRNIKDLSPTEIDGVLYLERDHVLAILNARISTLEEIMK